MCRSILPKKPRNPVKKQPPLFHRFANPGSFYRLVRPGIPYFSGLGIVILAVGLCDGLFFSPSDWQQGETVRIMYLHVPMAWLGTACYAALALCGFLSLVWRHPIADIAALEIGPIGACATALCLITGSLWGKPTWGTWWVWDARLTSMLVLFFLYLGHITLIRAFDDPGRGQKAAAILALIGAVDLPIIKFSVKWWNTLHQPASLTFSNAPTISVSILLPLLLCTLGFTLCTIALISARICAQINERRCLRLLSQENVA